MKMIWNGFETTPHTPPSACFICYGSVEGDFAALPCGHGKPEKGPIHVKCLIKSFDQPHPYDLDLNSDMELAWKPPHCPVCRKDVDPKIISGLALYARSWGTISFPDGEDHKQVIPVYKTPEEAIKLLTILSDAQHAVKEHETVSPAKEEKRASYWKGILRDAEQFTKAVENEIGAGFSRQEDLAKRQEELEVKTGCLISAAGRLAFFRYRDNGAPSGLLEPSYFEVYKNFTKMGQRLGQIGLLLREEQTVFQLREKEGISSVKRIWNGFDVTPPVKPASCALCSGEKGGDFVVLDCGHGSPKNTPLHVECILEQVQCRAKDGELLTCPTCQKPVREGTLSRLADFIYRKEVVIYPDPNGLQQHDDSYLEKNQKDSVIGLLATIQNAEIETEGILPLSAKKMRNHYASVIEGANQLIERVNKGVSEHTYTPENIEEDLRRVESVRDLMDLSAGQALRSGHVGSWNRSDLEKIRNKLSLKSAQFVHVSGLLHQEKQRIEIQNNEHVEHDGKVWSGFETGPETRPMDCVACLGKYGGDFVSLDCGHGRPENSPLHVRCVLEIATSAAAHETAARCPVCSAEISADALVSLTEYTHRNEDITFPGDDGLSQTAPLFDTSENQKNALEALKELKSRSSEGDMSSKQSNISNENKDHLVRNIEHLVKDVEHGTRERLYTLEELEEKQRELEALEHQAAMMAQSMDRHTTSVTSFEESHTRLLAAQRKLETEKNHLRQEKESMEHREKEHT